MDYIDGLQNQGAYDAAEGEDENNTEIVSNGFIPSLNSEAQQAAQIRNQLYPVEITLPQQ